MGSHKKLMGVIEDRVAQLKAEMDANVDDAMAWKLLEARRNELQDLLSIYLKQLYR